MAEERGCALTDLTLADLKSLHELFGDDVSLRTHTKRARRHARTHARSVRDRGTIALHAHRSSRTRHTHSCCKSTRRALPCIPSASILCHSSTLVAERSHPAQLRLVGGPKGVPMTESLTRRDTRTHTHTHMRRASEDLRMRASLSLCPRTHACINSPLPSPSTSNGRRATSTRLASRDRRIALINAPLPPDPRSWQCGTSRRPSSGATRQVAPRSVPCSTKRASSRDGRSRQGHERMGVANGRRNDAVERWGVARQRVRATEAG
jgi:hypothetical protein